MPTLPWLKEEKINLYFVYFALVKRRKNKFLLCLLCLINSWNNKSLLCLLCLVIIWKNKSLLCLSLPQTNKNKLHRFEHTLPTLYLLCLLCILHTPCLQHLWKFRKFLVKLLTCSWHQKTNSPILQFTKLKCCKMSL